MNAWIEDRKLHTTTQVAVVEEDSGCVTLLRSILKVYRSAAVNKTVIYFGAGLKGLLWVLSCRLIGVKILLRLGGAEPYTLRALAAESYRAARYHESFRHFMNALSAVPAMRMASGLIVVSNRLAERVRSEGSVKNDRPVFVIHQPVSELFAERGDIREPVIRKDQAGNLLTVTNLRFGDKLEHVKTIVKAMLSSAWSSCCSGTADIEYVIAGGGPHLDELKKFAGVVAPELGKRNVTLKVLGHVDNLHLLYTWADVFIYGSMNDGVPNVVLEAEWYGLPIVINDTEDHRQLFQKGRNASYYRTGDPEDAARTLGNIVFDREKRLKMSGINYHDVREQFGLDAVLKQVEPMMQFCGADIWHEEKDLSNVR
jgi:glycosyltransferase involved in cell wall biosynthesis